MSKYDFMMRIKFLLFFMLLTAAVWGQGSMTVLTGKVVDRQTGRALAHVSVSSPNGRQQTVTNDDGQFVLKTPSQPAYVEFSHLGYHTRRMRIDGQTENLRVSMVPSAIEIDEVVVMMNDPMEVLRAAIKKIPANYSMQPSLMHCFYRETAQKGSRFIAISEAVTQMYKTPYNVGVTRDAVQIVKGRRLLSTKAKDTLGVKVMGGPVIPIMLDVVKNSELLLNEEELQLYRLTMEMPERIDLRSQFVISFVPLYRVSRPLFYGKFYIDQETLSFTRVELNLEMDDRDKATNYMLVRKPLGLHFNPKELTTTINYQTTDSVTHISYVRNVMKFKCDWKRRLFSSAYTVTTEMVVTDMAPAGEVHSIRGRDSFGLRDYFYDKVSFFDEPDFWGNYNIIEPTESLEHAINKLKKSAKM